MSYVHINLWNIAGAGLIIPHKTNVLYLTQAGGITCAHPSLEGVFVPLPHGELIANDLNYYFVKGEKWKGYCYLGDLREDDADYLDDLFQKRYETKYLKVDRSALKSGGEAWVHVTLHYPEEKHPLFTGLESKTAVLTWANSD